MNGNGYAKVLVKVKYDDNMTGNKNLMESGMLLLISLELFHDTKTVDSCVKFIEQRFEP